MANQPKAYAIYPARLGRSLETINARLRDAMKSYLDKKWQSYIDYEKFKGIHPFLKVSLRNGIVYVGTQMALDTMNNSPESRPAHRHPKPCATHEEFKHLCIVAHNKLLNIPLQVQVPFDNLNEWAEHANDSFDIEVTISATNELVII